MFQKNFPRNTLTAGLVLILVVLAVINPKQAEASLFDDFLKEMNNKLKAGVDGVKDLVAPKKENKALALDPEIKLAEGGDINKNGGIDSGDYVKFIYVITNTTNNLISQGTLKTNINTKKLNGVRNVTGTFNVEEKDNSITIPNLAINPNQKRTISFEIQTNFNKDTDEIISTEAELLSNDKSVLFKSQKKEVVAKKIDMESFDKFVHKTKK